MINLFNMKPIFPVLINNQQYFVYDIDKSVKTPHEGFNDTPSTWWLFYNTDLFLTEELLNSEQLIPYCVKSIPRFNWDINIKQVTETKYKWDNIRFNPRTICELFVNKKKIYEFITTGGESGLNYAFSRANYLRTALLEHPYDFVNSSKNKNRKIYYLGLPAFVEPLDSEPWKIRIIPDYSVITKYEWWEQLKNTDKLIFNPSNDPEYSFASDQIGEYMQKDFINWGDAFNSENVIYWYRQ